MAMLRISSRPRGSTLQEIDTQSLVGQGQTSGQAGATGRAVVQPTEDKQAIQQGIVMT